MGERRYSTAILDLGTRWNEKKDLINVQIINFAGTSADNAVTLKKNTVSSG
jgi:hypothetical protein